jgi:mRNA-degrading endonuclease RelE of RelBE toxin-antitoxin system
LSRRLGWTSRALKEASKLDRQALARVRASLDRFVESGYGDIVKLQDVEPPEYRLRVGDYRVRLRLRGEVVEVLQVLPRDKAYR